MKNRKEGLKTKVQIDRVQYFFLIPNILFGKAIGITAGVMARKIGADTWTSMIIGFLIGTIFVLLMTYLSSRFPEENILQFSLKLIGKLPTKLLGIILAVYFALAFAVSANVINMHVKEYLLPETPFIIISAVYIIVCTYGVILGIEVVSRFAIFGFIMLQGINITMMLGTVKDFKFENLLPVFNNGILTNITNSMYVFSDIAMVILGLGIFYPLISDKKKSISIALLGMLVGAISVLVWPIMEVGVMGADVMKQFVVVCMQQVRSAELTVYLPRYELIMVIFFVWSVFVQSTLMFYCSVNCINHIINIKKNWKTPVILTPILIMITYYMGFDHNNYIIFLGSYWSQISAGLSIGIPLLLLLTYFIRKKLNKSDQSKKQANV